MTENILEQEVEETTTTTNNKETINLTDLAFIVSTYLEGKYKVKVSEHRMGYILKSLVEVLSGLIKDNKKIRLKGFGVFETETYKARTGFSYLTNQVTFTEEHQVPKWKPSRGFKKFIRFGVPVDVNED